MIHRAERQLIDAGVFQHGTRKKGTRCKPFGLFVLKNVVPRVVRLPRVDSATFVDRNPLNPQCFHWSCLWVGENMKKKRGMCNQPLC